METRRPAQPPRDIDVTAHCAGPNCGRAHCDQTSMQLKITTSKATTIKVTKVELLDDKGKLLEVLTSRAPRHWVTDKYVAWDEKVPAASSAQVMYDLSMPSWNKLGGRFNAQNKTYQVRVSVTVGTANRTIERQSITPVRLPPPVPT